MAGASVASTPPRTLTAAICPRGWLPTSVEISAIRSLPGSLPGRRCQLRLAAAGGCLTP